MNKDSQALTLINKYSGIPMAISGNAALQALASANESANNKNEQLSITMYREMLASYQPKFYSLSGSHISANDNIQISEVAGKNKSVAVLNLKGVMVSEGGMCTRGIDALCDEITAVANNPNFTGAVIKTDSGGGEVAAAQKVQNALSEARKKKPFVQFVDGQAASGAYWVGALCDAIVLGGKTTSVGSIGVVIDLNKEGIEWVRDNSISIFSNGSEEKRDVWKAILDGNHEYVRTESLDPIKKIFDSIVKKGRANLNPSILNEKGQISAKMFMGNKAINNGMADSIGVLSDAVKLVGKLSRQRAAKSLINV